MSHTNGNHKIASDHNHCNGSSDINVNKTYLQCLEEPYYYHTKNPGKAIRDYLITAINQWLCVDPSILDGIKEAIKILHESSLMVDDIQDSSKMRRGAPAAYQIYGISEVINIANMKYFEAGRIVSELGTDASYMSEASRIFNLSMIKLHQGQGLDIYWRDHYICPTEEEYTDMILKKTGGLMLLAFDLMYLFRDVAKCDKRLTKDVGHELLETFSKFFQIRDDFCNLWDKSYAAKKSYCEDLTEGKFSWVIIQGIHKEEKRGDNTVLSILKKRTKEDHIKAYCCKVLESLNVKSDTKDYLMELEDNLRNQINSLSGNQVFEDIIDLLSVNRIEVIDNSKDLN